MTAPKPIAPIDPTNQRPLLFLLVAEELMKGPDWEHRVATIQMESAYGPGRYTFFGANHPDAVTAVHERRVDVSVLNPAAMLTMAHRGTGPFPGPLDVATIATIPHYDQLGFAVADRLGFGSLDDIAAARRPLRVSVRGSVDACTSMMVDVALAAHGLSLADIVAWGGTVSYDQPMPDDPSRIGALADGRLDAIFDEGVVLWADRLAAAGARFLPIDDDRMAVLAEAGFRRGVIERDRYPTLPSDVPTLDYGGWPLYCHSDADPAFISRFCEALIAQAGRIPWGIGGFDQPPLPLARMVLDAPDTPSDVPMHPAAIEAWRKHGYL